MKSPNPPTTDFAGLQTYSVNLHPLDRGRDCLTIFLFSPNTGQGKRNHLPGKAALRPTLPCARWFYQPFTRQKQGEPPPPIPRLRPAELKWMDKSILPTLEQMASVDFPSSEYQYPGALAFAGVMFVNQQF